MTLHDGTFRGIQVGIARAALTTQSVSLRVDRERGTLLMITTAYRLAADTGPTWVLRLDGNLVGELVKDLRREWRRVRNANDAIPVLVELADTDFIDTSGKLLLVEMQRAGVHVDWEPDRQFEGELARDCQLARYRN